MRKFAGLLMIAVLFVNCTPKKAPGVAFVNGILIDTTPVVWVIDTAAGDFVFDSTLQRLYVEEPEHIASLYEDGKEVSSAEEAFKIVEPILVNAYGEENISHQKPFHINLVDSIWIIEGTLPKTANGEAVLGGTAYIEIRKKNGGFVKCIHGE